MLEVFIWFNLSFLFRMLVIFTVMMKYYHWVQRGDAVWKAVLWTLTEWPWKIIAGAFFLADVVYNWYLGIIFWDKPAPWDETVTYRMKRYIAEASGIKLFFAKFLRVVLNYSDPGHI